VLLFYAILDFQQENTIHEQLQLPRLTRNISDGIHSLSP